MWDLDFSTLVAVSVHGLTFQHIPDMFGFDWHICSCINCHANLRLTPPLRFKEAPFPDIYGLSCFFKPSRFTSGCYRPPPEQRLTARPSDVMKRNGIQRGNITSYGEHGNEKNVKSNVCFGLESAIQLIQLKREEIVSDSLNNLFQGYTDYK